MDPLSEFLQGTNLGADGGTVTSVEILLALGLSFVLMLAIGLIYQRTHRGERYSQDYVHMLIMLGLLVTVVIMGIAGNTARAFGIFAAFSIIRFRRSVPEARDIGFIFFAMAVGLSVGGHEYALAVLTTVAVGAAILALSRLDLFAARRPTHWLRVRMTHDIDHVAAFNDVFARLLARWTLLSVESVQAGLMVEVSFAVQLGEGTDPLALVAEIQARNGNNRVILRALPTGNVDDD